MLDLKTKTHLTHCIFLHNHDSTTIQLSWLIWKDATILCTLRRILSSISFVMPESTIDENWNVFTTIDWRCDDVLFVPPFYFDSKKWLIGPVKSQPSIWLQNSTAYRPSPQMVTVTLQANAKGSVPPPIACARSLSLDTQSTPRNWIATVLTRSQSTTRAFAGLDFGRTFGRKPRNRPGEQCPHPQRSATAFHKTLLQAHSKS